MDKQEFVERRNALSKQMNDLAEEYIKTNIPFPVGTKVKVTGENGKSRIGIVKDSIISGSDVVPLVMQITNDGRESLRRIVVYEGDKVETIE